MANSNVLRNTKFVNILDANVVDAHIQLLENSSYAVFASEN